MDKWNPDEQLDVWLPFISLPTLHILNSKEKADTTYNSSLFHKQQTLSEHF